MLFDTINYTYLAILSVVVVVPLIIILSGSFTAEKQIVLEGVTIIPKEWSLEAYRYLLSQNNSILSAYKITILVTAVGTLLSLFVTAALAYAISIRKLVLRNAISFFVYFTMLFNGGLIPWYILCVNYLGLKNKFWALILPMLVNPFYVMLMRTFFRGLPESFRESGNMDGASELKIFYKIILPMSMPIVATITLFYLLSYWNDFYNALFFVNKNELIPLQFHLYKIMSTINFLSQAKGPESGGSSAGAAGHVILPSEGVRLATTILTIGPIIFVYPFIQKHFIKGITIGGIKG